MEGHHSLDEPPVSNFLQCYVNCVAASKGFFQSRNHMPPGTLGSAFGSGANRIDLADPHPLCTTLLGIKSKLLYIFYNTGRQRAGNKINARTQKHVEVDFVCNKFLINSFRESFIGRITGDCNALCKLGN